MINDKAILVGVDGSHASYKATWWAANYAKHAGLTLQIVCAYSLPSLCRRSFDATSRRWGTIPPRIPMLRRFCPRPRPSQTSRRRSRHTDCYRRSGIGVRRIVS